MAEPPPIDFEVESEEPSPQEEEEKPEEKPEAKPEEDEEEEEDLFSSPEVPQQQAGEEEEKGEGDQEPSKPAQLIVETEKEPPTEVEPDTSSAPTLEIHAADESEDVVVQTKPVAPPPAKTLDLFDEEEEPKKEEQQEKEEKEEEDEGDDTFEMEITVVNPEKVGDGMSAYMAYTVMTKTTIPDFKKPETTVRRRFSDFLGLHQRMAGKYSQKGRIVPPAPEKSMMGTTRVKFSKSEENSAAFIERRRASLERYLNRVGKHPALRKDEYFRDFLEDPHDLPKATDTGAFSGAGFMRLVKNVGESISKIGGKKTETDSWFEEQQQDYEVLDDHLKKLHAALEVMIGNRKELCSSTTAFVKSVATLGNVEENNSVSRALSRLSEVEEKVESLHQEQLNSDLYVFAETVKDYISLLASIKVTFDFRVKAYHTWQSAQNTLTKKRETEMKLQAGGKQEKIAQIQQEIKEWEGKVEDGQKNFEEVSETLKKEVKRFEEQRTHEFKTKFISYLEALMHMQQELIRLWEGYLPDAQAIA